MADLPALAPLRQETAPLRRKIAASLRAAIESGGLPPGARLVEKDLCQQLSVSRTSLREAIRELESEGLLITGPGGGVAVAGMTEAEARNIYRVRGALEALAAEQFAERADDAMIQELKDASARLADAYDSGVIAEMLAAKRHFYETLCRGAGNPVVMDLLNRLNARINLLRSTSLGAQGRLAVSITEIKALVEALARRDAAAARQVAEAHVAAAADAALGG